jgi:hypothetical protein
MPHRCCCFLSTGTGATGSQGLGFNLLVALAALHGFFALMASLARPYNQLLRGYLQQASHWLVALLHVAVVLAYKIDTLWGVRGSLPGWLGLLHVAICRVASCAALLRKHAQPVLLQVCAS